MKTKLVANLIMIASFLIFLFGMLPGAFAQCPADFPVDCGDGICCPQDYPSCCNQQNPRLKICCPADYPYCGKLGRKCYQNPPGPCALSLIARGDAATLKVLRSFRDAMLRNTPTGKQYISLFYQYSPELISILSADSELMNQSEALLYNSIPSIESLLANNKDIITEDMLLELLTLCADFSKKASPGLQEAIRMVVDNLKEGKLIDELLNVDPAVLIKKQPESVEPIKSGVK
jgi:hypothetical protein